MRTTVVFLGADMLSLPLESMLSRPDVDVRAVFAPDAPAYRRVRALASRSLLVSEPLDAARHASLFAGIDVILTAGYNSKMPDLGAKYPLNLHPTLLPKGRGPRPIPWILFDRADIAGVTLHVLTDEYDAGPIVASRRVMGATALSFEGYVMTCNQLAAELVSCFLDDPDGQFRAAKAQDVGRFAPLPAFPEHRRTIAADMRGLDIVAVIRKLGPIGALLEVGDARLRVTGAEFIPDPGHRPHKTFENNSLYSALRCRDGFILFKPGDLHRA